MPTHIGFLRAVNIGKRPYKTADLRAALTAAGYDDVDTYIQTGNVRVGSPLRSRAKIEAELEGVFLADRGFEVPTMVFTPAELRAVAAEADEIAEQGYTSGHYINLLKRPIPADLLDELTELTQEGVRFVASDRAMHLLYDIPFGTAKPATARANKIIGVATNRSAKVIREIAERWC
ncbi:DUF1697 domain-containing protein [Nocardioides marmoriginsengisoli]|nr:DUF1697 domain-containing protein [Nocardioides marmoriginsengisoli]